MAKDVAGQVKRRWIERGAARNLRGNGQLEVLVGLSVARRRARVGRSSKAVEETECRVEKLAHVHLCRALLPAIPLSHSQPQRGIRAARSHRTSTKEARRNGVDGAKQMAWCWMKGKGVVAQECCSRAHRAAANGFPGSRLRRGSDGWADRTERKEGRLTRQPKEEGRGKGTPAERSLTQTQTAQRGKTGFCDTEGEVVVGWRGKWRVEGGFAYGTAKTCKPTSGIR